MPAYWIWLSQRTGMGNKAKLELAGHFDSAAALWQAQDYAAFNLPEEARKSLADKDLSETEKILRRCRNLGISVLCAGDPAYPRRLRNIADPPVVLYYKGTLPDFDREAAVGVVGTRRASAYGMMAAERISRQIAQRGGLVISGLASGIDAQAGWGAIHGGGQTVAVLGGGVDVIYPAANWDLYQAVEQQGCILSEYPPGTKPTKWTFPHRNRIVSGLSCGVLVVEAPEKSGTMITARYASEQGRDVFVVPGHIDSEFCAGSNALLRDGAKLATCGWDILREYEGLFPDKLQRQAFVPVQPSKPAKVQPAGRPARFDQATAEEQALLQPLLQGDRTVDDLIAVSGLDPQKALATLTMLELKGMVTTLPGRRITLA